jgi:hypothetical protein
MNKIKNTLFAFIAIVFVQFMALAQDVLGRPGDFGGTEPADTNPTDALIDTYVWVLLVVGLGYIFSKQKTRSKA